MAAGVVEVLKDVGAADAAGDLENAGADDEGAEDGVETGTEAGVDAGIDAEALADDDDDAAGGAGAAAPPGHKVKVRSLSSGHTLVRMSSGMLYAASHVA